MRFQSILLLLTQTTILLLAFSLRSSSAIRILPGRSNSARITNNNKKNAASRGQATPPPALANNNNNNNNESSIKRLVAKKNPTTTVDYGAIGRYMGGLSIQVTALYLVWSIIDRAIASLTTKDTSSSSGLPRWASFLLVYFLNLQASKFSPLPTARESKYSSPGRKRPSWTPPGWMFAVMWPLFVFGTRAYTMAVIREKVGYYANPVTMSLMLHLGVATLWSTINRVEERLGVSILMLYGMVITKAVTAYLAYQIDPKSGIALAATLSWLVAAAALGTDTWRINPDPKTGKRELLYPVKYN